MESLSEKSEPVSLSGDASSPKTEVTVQTQEVRRDLGDISDGNAPPKPSLSSPQLVGLVIMNVIGSYVSGYDVSNLANIQAPVYQAFGHIELLSWVSVAYALANAATIPFFRKIAGFCPLRPLACFSLLAFIVGAAICGAAPSIVVLIVGRALNGVGAAGVYQVNQYYNVTFCRPADLPRMQSLVGLCWALGILSGPAIGGAFAANPHATWRWAFYINLPLCLPLFPLLLLIPPLSLAPSTPRLTSLLALDWAGFLLHSLSLTLLSLSLLLSGTHFPWLSAATIALWTTTLVTLLLYATQQTLPLLTTAPARLLPLPLLRNRTTILTALGTCTSSTTYALTMYYTPLFFSFARGAAPLATATHLLPFIATLIVAVLLAGALLPAVRYYKAYYLAAGVLYIAGGALLATVTPATPDAAIMGYLAVLGFATGLTWQTALGITGAVLPDEGGQKLDAAALQSMAQLVPVVVALGVAGCVYQNRGLSVVRAAVAGREGFATEEEIREALAGLASAVFEAGRGGEVVTRVVEGLTGVITGLFWIVVAVGGGCFAAGLGMRWEALEFGKRRRGGEDVEE
ncbi:major facilitator superfamily domain-containing protein [Podospora appendiculata]|uniref:Major facilitator superfamily domain-containing protein n=1 Tax=Podospora appendiculata TaxID=314037 RepID=A0AAE0XBW5_9PEZI|nr:major facilitator superfamily domain-containing protein [Podospora appendiculata]